MNKLILSLAGSLLLAASCAAASSIAPPAPGTTIAKGKLLQDTMNSLNIQQLWYRDGCTHVFVESVRPVKKGARLIVGPDGKPVGGRLQEIWVVNRCGKRVNTLVTYQPDPRGGTMVGVTVLKP